ncbi:hypothetical protein D3C81_1984890 [compost metagenome]
MPIDAIQLDPMINIRLKLLKLLKKSQIPVYPFCELLHLTQRNHSEHIRRNIVVEITGIVAGTEPGPDHPCVVDGHPHTLIAD